MKRIIIIFLSITFILLILLLYITNDNYYNNISKSIKDNYANINLYYVNKYNDYYIFLSDENYGVLDGEYNKLDQGSKYLLSIQIQTMLNTNNFNNNISKEDYDRLVIEIQNAQAVTNEFIRQNVRDYDCMEYTNNKSYSKVRSL